MKIEALIFVGLFWLLPVSVGLWFSVCVWLVCERFNYGIAAIFRALAVAGTFAPGYIPATGFIPIPASVLLFLTPTDSTFLEQAEAAIPTILFLWVFLLPIFILTGYFLHKRKLSLTHPSSGTR